MNKKMRVLVACEESQAVTKELRRLGHEAYSCDIIDCSGGHPEWHIKQDVLPLLNGSCSFRTMDGTTHAIDRRWDMIIAHPPCTYMSKAGARWMFPKAGAVDERRFALAMKAKEFFFELLECGLRKDRCRESAASQNCRVAETNTGCPALRTRTSIQQSDLFMA